MGPKHGRRSLQLSAEEIATVLQAGQIPVDETGGLIAKALRAALEEVERWRDLPALDRKAYRQGLGDAVKHLRRAASSFKSAQPALHEALNRTVQRRFFEYLPVALIHRLVPPTRMYRPSPRDLESRAWQEGDYEAWSYAWRHDYLGEHGAYTIATSFDGLADELDRQLAIEQASASRGGAPGHPERDRLIAHLIALWEHDLGRRATGTPTGDFVALTNALFSRSVGMRITIGAFSGFSRKPEIVRPNASDRGAAAQCVERIIAGPHPLEV